MSLEQKISELNERLDKMIVLLDKGVKSTFPAAEKTVVTPPEAPVVEAQPVTPKAEPAPEPEAPAQVESAEPEPTQTEQKTEAPTPVAQSVEDARLELRQVLGRWTSGMNHDQQVRIWRHVCPIGKRIKDLSAEEINDPLAVVREDKRKLEAAGLKPGTDDHEAVLSCIGA